MSRDNPSRRQFLRAAVPAAVAGLAGCSDRSGDTPPATTGAARTDTAAPTTRDGTPTTPSPTPTTPSPATVAGWVADASVPLGSVDPSASLAPLDPLADAFADATVVGMGEATHGTREFFRLKHRLLRFLVEELGYRVFAWEANFSETLAVDEYVRRGEGDPTAALDGIHYWAWDARSVLEMVEWLRSFNEGRPPGDRVRFYGFDVQYATGPASRLDSYLETVDADVHGEVAPDLALLAEQGFDDDAGTPLDDRLATAEALVADLRAAFERNRGAYVEASSGEGYRLARRHLWTLARAREYAAADREESSALRDRAMAATVDWILEHEDADGVALWAHTAHVAANDDHYSADPMGKHLRAAHGDAYYPLGFEFARGRFRARSMTDGELAEFTVDEPPEGTFPAALSAAGASPFALDFASVGNPDLAGWLDRPRSIHGAGTVFDPSWTWPRYTDRVDLTAAFDGVAFVVESTPTRPVEGGASQPGAGGP